MDNNSQSPGVALVIGSGSILCAASIGLQRVLQREGIRITRTVGCSAGAIYAAAIALGYDADKIEDMTYRFWKRETTSKRNPRALLQTLMPKVFGFQDDFGLIDDRPVNAALRKGFGDLTFDDTQIPTQVVMTDFYGGEKVVVNEGPIFDAVRGSLAIPFVFKPWEVNGRLCMDGFMTDPMPVDVAIQAGSHTIIALGFDSPLQHHIDSTIRYAFQVTTVMRNTLLRANFGFHSLAHHAEILNIVPEFEERIGAFDTTKVPHIIEQGEKAMEAQMPYLERVLQASAH